MWRGAGGMGGKAGLAGVLTPGATLSLPQNQASTCADSKPVPSCPAYLGPTHPFFPPAQSQRAAIGGPRCWQARAGGQMGRGDESSCEVPGRASWVGSTHICCLYCPPQLPRQCLLFLSHHNATSIPSPRFLEKPDHWGRPGPTPP